MSLQSKWVKSSAGDALCNGTCEGETMVALRCPRDGGDDAAAAAAGDRLALSNDGVSEFSNSDLSLPEVCVSTNSRSFEEDMTYEVQQAYRIFSGFLLDKHKGIAGPFLNPVGHQEAQHGVGGVKGRGQSHLRQSMCLRRMEEKFAGQEYETITEFVTDFRLMLENCYRYHGVDHWISKQAQKLEIMLEQKLTLLSRTLREKTTLAVTSKGRFGAEEDRSSGGTTTRRRLAPRSLATLTVGGHESIMVQSLRLEEQQRAKEEKRQRELEKKEAEEMSAKEVEEWEHSLLSQASPQAVDTLWELPALGHFLCLAQTALNLPEVVFFELERCLLMPRCSLLLSKIMSSLLSPPQRRATLHRRPALPYRRWESELRQRVAGWYRTVGASRDQPGRAEQLGLCHQFFGVLGEVSPLEERAFHLLPFHQRVWLLKGLCDHVYETQKDVQDAVLAQPIHECRESILGYDSKENAYIHFPHFCGADLRIYCQSPSTPPAFPFPPVLVRKVEKELAAEVEESDGVKDEEGKNDGECYGAPPDAEGLTAFGRSRPENLSVIKKEKGIGPDEKTAFDSWSQMKEEGSESGSSDSDSGEDSKMDLKAHNNSLSVLRVSPSTGAGGVGGKISLKDETFDDERPSKILTLKQEQGCSLGSVRVIKDTQDPCLNVGEHSYTGRSPARSATLPSPTKTSEDGGSPGRGQRRSSTWDHCESKASPVKCKAEDCDGGPSRPTPQLSSESAPNSSEERLSEKIWTKKKRRKKKRGREPPLRVKGEHKQPQHEDPTRTPPTEAAKFALRKVTSAIKRKEKKKKHKTGKKSESSKKIKEELPVEPSFKLVCTSLEELRELISKTEDELDDLESSKNRLGRWYYRREAVKDLHSTLIRLLNELSPWEPKLVRAYQRNRLRLKKEFDDFKKHPEYNNFVREECVSSSSDDDDADEERDLGKEACSLTDHYGRSEEDLDHVVPRGLWSGASTRELDVEPAAEKATSCAPANNLNYLLASPEKDVGLPPSIQTVSVNVTSADSKQLSATELIPTNQSRDPASAASVSARAATSPRSQILHPTCGLPKGYTPIPTLLAKSVGNKVTLMKRPADFPGAGSLGGQSKGPSFWLPTSALGNANVSEAQSPPSGSQASTQQGPAQAQALGQPGGTPATAAPPKAPQNTPIQTAPKTPVQVVYKVPEGLGHLVKKDSGGPIKFSVHPVVDKNTGENIMQQVVILPSNLLIQKTDAKASASYQQQSKGIEVAASKAASPLCMSTDVPGFSIPENRIPVQQVAPLKDARTVRSPPPSVLPCLQQGATSTAGFKATQVCGIQPAKQQGVPSHPAAVPALSSAASAEPAKTTDPKQELKTVCIRDSQSILVTTRGGNTGIVKVQASSDPGALGSFPNSPVITISPQFKAFLVSKTLPTLSQPSPSTDPAMTITSAPSQKQTSSVAKPTSTNPTCTAVTGSIPTGDPGSHNTATTVALSQGSSTFGGPTVGSKIAQLAQTSAAGSQIQASVLKNTVVVPSPSRSNVPQLLSQGFVSKNSVKRASTDEGSHIPKFILVAPSSPSVTNVALPKGTPTSPKSVPSSRVMIIGQPTVSSPPTFMGGIPKQAMVTAVSGQAVTTSLPSHTLKMGLGVAQPVGGGGSEALSRAKTIAVPTGVPIQLSGKTTTIGQTIGALSYSPSKCAPVSVSGAPCPIAATTGPAPVTSLITFKNCSTLPSSGSLTTSSQFQGLLSQSKISQMGSLTPTQAVSTLPAGNTADKDSSMPAGVLTNSSPVQVATTSISSPLQTFPFSPDSQLSSARSGIGAETSSTSSSSHQLTRNKSQTPLSSAPASCSLSTASPAGTVQQRVVINTATPLAAGTQIFLNNACFVVPPQGLGAGSHVLIISTPAPQQVPAASGTSTGASVPYQGASNAAVAPLAPVLPQSPVRQPAVPAVTSPFVACTPALGPSLLPSAPHVAPVNLTGAGLSSVLLPCKTSVVSARPRLPAAPAGLPAPVSPVVTSAAALGSSLAAVQLAAPARAESPSVVSPTAAPAFAGLPRSLSSFPVTVSTSAVGPPLSSSAVATDTTASLCSVPTQQILTMTPLGAGLQPHPTAVRIAAPAAGQPQALVHKGLGSISIRKQGAVLQPGLAGTRTQILPTVAVPPIVNAVSRIQTLPIATVPPIGSTVSTTETPPVGAAPSSHSAGPVNPGQPITSLKANNTFSSSLILTNQSFGKLPPQTAATAVHSNVASKLLISPDGAVLSAVEAHINSTERTACHKPLEAPEISTNSSAGALQTHDSSLQPQQSDTK